MQQLSAVSVEAKLFDLRIEVILFWLQQAAGQAVDSPCVDAGDPDAPLIPGTTRTDLELDTGIVDMGFHFTAPGAPGSFLRGDVDGNGLFTGLVDGLYALGFQFQGGPAPPCLEAADADGNGSFNGSFNGLVDALYLLTHQFQGGPPPPAPYPSCGPDLDPAGTLGCGPNACP